MTSFADAKLQVLADPDAMASAAADWMLAAALETKGRFAVALSGGSTPRALYQKLASPPYLGRFPWDRVHWFWGDERFVPHDDPRSNYRMTLEAMLAHAPIPPANIHPVATESADPEAAASAYARDLQAFYGAARLDPGRPLFDITLLGLGSDGHTASLFPGTAVLDERQKWAAAVVGAQAEARITLTYPVLDSSRRTAFLVAGADKRPMLDRLRRGDDALPAARLRPAGTLWIFADAAAAGPT
jgi:6-phosphogluconolactonase